MKNWWDMWWHRFKITFWIECDLATSRAVCGQDTILISEPHITRFKICPPGLNTVLAVCIQWRLALRVHGGANRGRDMNTLPLTPVMTLKLQRHTVDENNNFHVSSSSSFSHSEPRHRTLPPTAHPACKPTHVLNSLLILTQSLAAHWNSLRNSTRQQLQPTLWQASFTGHYRCEIWRNVEYIWQHSWLCLLDLLE